MAKMMAYMIYVESSDRSVNCAKKSQKMAKKIGKIDAKLWPGIDKYNVWNELEKKDLNIIPLHIRAQTYSYKKYIGSGYMDCEAATFLSHMSLWEESIRIDDRILILEHDAIFFKKFIDYKYDGILNLGIPNWGTRKWTDELDDIYIREKCRNNHSPWIYTLNEADEVVIFNDEPCKCETQWLFGAHAYIITPKEAKKLINDSYDNGIFATDLFIRTEIVNIADQLPHGVKQVSDFSLIQKYGKTKLITSKEAWKNYD